VFGEKNSEKPWHTKRRREDGGGKGVNEGGNPSVI